MLRIGLKLWSINTDAYLREAQRLYAEGVFDYLELFVVPGTLDRLPLWQKVEMPFVLHHAHSAAGFNPAIAEKFSGNERIATETREYARALNPKHIIFHGGTNGTAEEAARQLAYFKQTSFSDQSVVVENKPFKPLPNKLGITECRGSNIAELAIIIGRVQCGMCLDFGHAVASANTQHLDPYAFIAQLNDRFQPKMYHLSDFVDMTSEFDAHPHLGTGNLDIARLVHDILPSDAMVSIETVKNSKDNLDDFKKDVEWLRQFE